MVTNIGTIIILCGGQSNRLKTSKPFLKLGSTTLIEYVVNRVKKYFKNIFIIVKSSEDAEKIKAFLRNVTVLEDTVKDQQAPILGLLTAVEKISESVFFTLSCDMPLVDLNIVDMLIKPLGDHNPLIRRWPNGFIEPLFAVYRKEALEQSIRQVLSEGRFELTRMVSKL
ncbi:MAG: molybdenum cofactor guanylyltransferase, partial [Candidatus Odinarchaeota archaeon]